MGDLLQKLENYYEGAGILSTGFECLHYAECSKGCGRAKIVKGYEPFTEAKSAMVGVHYENNSSIKIPRLLVLSLDPGNPTSAGEKYVFCEPENRTPEGVRKMTEEDMKKELSPRRLHWRGTLEIVSVFMSKYRGVQLKNPLKECVGDELLKATRYFAHVNAVKCSQNKKGSKQAVSLLFQKCRDYLQEELETLAPNIVITQGAKAKEGFAYATGIKVKSIKGMYNPPNMREWKQIEIGGKEVLWFASVHPTARRASREKKRHLPGTKKHSGTREHYDHQRKYDWQSAAETAKEWWEKQPK